VSPCSRRRELLSAITGTLSVIDRNRVRDQSESLSAFAGMRMHFAYMQAKSFFYYLLTTTRVSLAPNCVPRWQMWPIPKPRDGMPIRIERLR
jgi:hypothetical protein